MNVDIAILGRPTADQNFTELGSQTLAFTGDRLAVSPTIPPAAAGMELRVRVTSADGLTFAVGAWLDEATRPAPTPILDDNGGVIGHEPGPDPVVTGRYCAWGGKSREAPLPARGASLVLMRIHGAAA
ncbi:hypothetical protein Q8W71_07320 [Methylobacterium sp. NEAU 140]|uniref:hypothetical protein n=1 Tax=Methylobacterium sp. NEAU 140 TaxID=3064945 RepID=UPI00273454C6|nr:hypothetical protein [Methylobacterium sp. NEAU 140]MDP4022427.1 hypothetical protein [Methylobacterium sp. NEAU 140]